MDVLAILAIVGLLASLAVALLMPPAYRWWLRRKGES